jgi:Fe-S-cluster-containing dehydrogenase component/DMSO reductase anchor subunit
MAGMTDLLGVPLPAGAAPLLHRARPAAGAPAEVTPIDRYLREQQTLTAVERFSRHHDADVLPAQARYYRDLVPLGRPGAGQQYGFEVDLDACSGCKACVAACHRLNGLDDGEAFRSVGTLVGTAPAPPEAEPALDLATMSITGGVAWQQTVTTACHHCVDPACLNGCPVDAYEKDPATGIVHHLDDQCIGCRYCTLMCPYEVPQYNPSRGIVRKCDLCADRLAEGEAPACVQACPTSAISVTVVDVADAVAAAGQGEALVPAAPGSSLTVPTTRYRSTRPIPAEALPADHFSVVPGHAHPPLTIMLVLTQAAIGAFVADLVLRRVALAGLAEMVRPVDAVAALGVGLLALGASVFHLGRPQYAWRAVIGLRHSWMSREGVALAAFAGLAAVYAAALGLGAPRPVVDVLGLAVAGAGAAGVGCSAMIYVVTGKRWWRARETFPKFVLTAVVAGSALILAVASIAAGVTDAGGAVLASAAPLLLAVGGGTVVKLAGELALLRHLRDRELSELRRTAMLLRGDLHHWLEARVAAGVAGGIVLPVVLWANWTQADPSVPASIVLSLAVVVLVLVGELTERWTFFTAVSSPRMPGGV